MLDKRMVIFSILIGLFAISCVSAADNVTDDVISVETPDELEIANGTDEISVSDDECLGVSQGDSVGIARDNSSDVEVLSVDETSECVSQSSDSALPDVLSISSSGDDLLASSYKSFHKKTFKVGKYKATFSAAQIKAVMREQKNGQWKEVVVKTSKYKTIKKTKYKTKTITKTVCFGKGKYTYGFWLQPYIQKGWKVVKLWNKGFYMHPQFGSMYKKNYAKFKKTVKVKAGTKTIKCRVKMSLVSYYLDGYHPGSDHAALYVWCSQGIISERSVYVY